MSNDFAFFKFQALGNDYIVIDPTRTVFDPTPKLVQSLCDRHRGIGSDGILLGPFPVPGDAEAFGLRVFNPDGSESEKSGNGLRIFARYLLEAGHVKRERCRIKTTGGLAEISYLAADGSKVQVDMGKPSFLAGDIPFTAIPPQQEVIETPLFLPSGPVTITALSVGNPHCVVFPGIVSPAEAQRLGPRIEKHPDFPNRVNVQFVEVLDRKRIRLEIWERGAGYTLASGSSSCAAAAASRRLGLVDDQLQVLMPGGAIDIVFTEQGRILMTGPVLSVYEGRLNAGWVP
ncbi:diaminopimelate epimerase [Geothrix sp. PMB-07]|uniref:diaminopimelate epimerase n=1 Tax=Geothrix sp. PMB-07 TaxID=3068640 RepID=UPI002741B280|nr:diaminopimelate epimerase [Geothrix sp. PMB-07]WLT32129.1 diaminopimelate epimerase [Geothrix sp. PMB-07]